MKFLYFQPLRRPFWFSSGTEVTSREWKYEEGTRGQYFKAWNIRENRIRSRCYLFPSFFLPFAFLHNVSLPPPPHTHTKLDFINKKILIPFQMYDFFNALLLHMPECSSKRDGEAASKHSSLGKNFLIN